MTDELNVQTQANTTSGKHVQENAHKSMSSAKRSDGSDGDLHGGQAPSSLADLSATLSASLDPSQLPVGQSKQRAYGFLIQGLRFIVPQGLFCELLIEPTVTPLPNSPSHFLGLSNVRGNLVPVYNFAGFSRRHDAPAGHSPYVLILGPVTTSAAVCIDGNPSAIDLSTAEQRAKTSSSPLPELPEFIWEAVTTTYTINDTLWHQLDPSVLFTKLSRLTH